MHVCNKRAACQPKPGTRRFNWILASTEGALLVAVTRCHSAAAWQRHAGRAVQVRCRSAQVSACGCSRGQSVLRNEDGEAPKGGLAVQPHGSERCCHLAKKSVQHVAAFAHIMLSMMLPAIILDQPQDAPDLHAEDLGMVTLTEMKASLTTSEPSSWMPQLSSGSSVKCRVTAAGGNSPYSILNCRCSVAASAS